MYALRMTSTNGVTLEGDDITKILSKLEASLKAKAEEGEEKGKASPEPGLDADGSPRGSPRKFTTFTTKLRPTPQVSMDTHREPRSILADPFLFVSLPYVSSRNVGRGGGGLRRCWRTRGG